MRAEETSSIVDDAPTRERVATTIMESGPSTAAALADRLGLTPAAVRRHLDQLLADGVLEAREPRMRGPRGRGRPAKVFVITDAGRDHFGHAYDALAADALRFVHQSGGDDAVSAFARKRLAGFEERVRPLMEAAKPEDRASILAEALTVDAAASGEQICQHHCPVAHVAGEFPHLCEAETEMFSRLLGTHVQRLATIANGDGVCTTHLPHQTSEKSAAERLPS